MKKIILYMLLPLALFSCKKPFSSGLEDHPQKVVYTDVINASFPDTLTTAAGAEMCGMQVEGIGFLYVGASEGSDVAFNYNDTAAVPSRIAYAFVPAGVVDSLVKGNLFFDLEQEQKAVSDGYDSDAAVFAGHVADKSAVMEPLFGLYEFTVNQADIASVEISASDNALAGSAKAVMNKPVEVNFLDGSKYDISLSGTLQMGCNYKAVALPAAHSALKIVLKNSYGVSVWNGSLEGDFSLQAGKTVNIGKLGNPEVSSLALSLSSEEYAGYKVKSIVGYSTETKKSILGGDVNQNFVSGQTLTARFFGLEPADYSSSKIWYVLTMENEGRSVVLPIECDGFKVPASTQVQQDLGIITSDRNAAPWYYPYEDTRLKCGAGYAFGDANTYLIQYKGGTYSGAVDPDPSIPQSVTIDYRVRGDLFGAPRPEGVSFEWKQGFNNTGAWDIYTNDRSKGGNVTSYSIDHDPDNYKVTVTNTGAQWGTPILLMKKGDEVLWAWVFWNIAADGSRLKAIDFGGTKLANMDIGQCSSPDQAAKITSKIVEIRRTTFYYQWGRPIPTFSANNLGAYFAQSDSRNHANPRIPVCDKGPVSVAEALQHPGELLHNPYTAGTASEYMLDWVEGGVSASRDLWGNDGKGSDVKSVYDPCPKGWKVPSQQVYKNEFPTAVKVYDVAKYPQENTTGYQGVYLADGLLFSCGGCFQTNLTASRAVSSGGLSYGTNNTANGNAIWWTNEFASGTKVWVFKADYYYVKYDKQTENTARTIGVQSTDIGRGYPVRCEVDSDNR